MRALSECLACRRWISWVSVGTRPRALEHRLLPLSLRGCAPFCPSFRLPLSLCLRARADWRCRDIAEDQRPAYLSAACSCQPGRGAADNGRPAGAQGDVSLGAVIAVMMCEPILFISFTFAAGKAHYLGGTPSATRGQLTRTVCRLPVGCDGARRSPCVLCATGELWSGPLSAGAAGDCVSLRPTNNLRTSACAVPPSGTAQPPATVPRIASQSSGVEASSTKYPQTHAARHRSRATAAGVP